MKPPELIIKDDLKLDDLSMAIIGELSKPRQESAETLSKITGHKKTQLELALGALIQKGFLRKNPNGKYEVIFNLEKGKMKFDETEKDVFDLLLTPNMLSASQLTKRSEILKELRPAIEALEEVVDKKINKEKVSIQLILKRLEHLLELHAVRKVSVDDKRVRFKYMLPETPACVTTKKTNRQTIFIPMKYKDDKNLNRMVMVILGCPYTGICDYCKTLKGECRIIKEVLKMTNGGKKGGE